MLMGASQPVEVIVHSSPTTWTIIGAALIALIGSAIVASAAVYGTRVAARNANERHEEQLEADFERFVAQLANERVMRSRDHVRDAIDAAVETADEALGTLATFAAIVVNGEESRDQMQDLLDDPETTQQEHQTVLEELTSALAQMNELSMAVFDKSQAMTSQRLRLRLRLRDDPIVAAAGTLEEALAQRHTLLRAAITERLSQEQLSEIEASQETLGAAFGEFMGGCEEWLAEDSEWPPEEPGDGGDVSVEAQEPGD